MNLTWKKVAFGAGILVGTFISVGIAVGKMIHVKKYSLEVEGLKQDVKIAVVSDAHNLRYESVLRGVLKKLERLNPDLIFLVGDINTEKDVLRSFDFIYHLTDLAKVYYVNGNHDNDHNNYGEFINELNVLNVQVIIDHSEVIEVNGEEFNIIGLKDIGYDTLFSESKVIKEQALRNYNVFLNNYDEERLNLVLSHRPNYLTRIIEHPNVIGFCGHTHGGQFRLPFSKTGLLVPDQGLFAKYGHGQFEGNDSIMYVNSGVGNHYLPRFYNPREIMYLKIEGENNE